MPPSKAKPRPVNAGLADKIERIRKATPPIASQFFILARELADEQGLDVNDVLDQFSERSSIRMYDGGLTHAEADRLGWADAVEMLTKQRRMAV